LKIAAEFLKRQPSIGRFYPINKDNSLGFTDPGSKRLAVDSKKMCASFVVTTDNADRVGDRVLTRGINLVNFATNPIGLFGHGELIFPIGRWKDRDGNLAVFPKEDHTEATIYFSQKDADARKVFVLVEEEIIVSASIGFNALSEGIKLRDTGGYQYDDWELLEISLCNVPMQPYATLLRKHLSDNKIDGETISKRLRQVLEPLAEPTPIWSPSGFSPIDMITGGSMAKKI